MFVWWCKFGRVRKKRLQYRICPNVVNGESCENICPSSLNHKLEGEGETKHIKNDDQRTYFKGWTQTNIDGNAGTILDTNDSIYLDIIIFQINSTKHDIWYCSFPNIRIFWIVPPFSNPERFWAGNVQLGGLGTAISCRFHQLLQPFFCIQSNSSSAQHGHGPEGFLKRRRCRDDLRFVLMFQLSPFDQLV